MKSKTKPVVPPVDPRFDAKALALLDKEAKGYNVSSLRVESETDYAAGGLLLHSIRDFYARVDEVFADDIKTAKALAKSLSDKSKKFKHPAEAVEERLRELMGLYLTRKQREAEREAQAAREKEIKAAKKAKDVEAVEELTRLPVVAQAAVLDEGNGGRKTWFGVVVDPAKLPKDYWIVDVERIDREAKMLKELFAVPGAEAKWRMGVVVR